MLEWKFIILWSTFSFWSLSWTAEFGLMSEMWWKGGEEGWDVKVDRQLCFYVTIFKKPLQLAKSVRTETYETKQKLAYIQNRNLTRTEPKLEQKNHILGRSQFSTRKNKFSYTFFTWFLIMVTYILGF